MRPFRFPACAATLLIAALVFTAGCSDGGPAGHVVKGKITNGGSVMTVKQHENKEGGNLRVWLINEDKAKLIDIYSADIKFDTGAFVIDGGKGRGIPAGKYKICVEWKDDYPAGPDKLKGRFSEQASKIIREIPPPGGELVIDVSKAEG